MAVGLVAAGRAIRFTRERSGVQSPPPIGFELFCFLSPLFPLFLPFFPHLGPNLPTPLGPPVKRMPCPPAAVRRPRRAEAAAGARTSVGARRGHISLCARAQAAADGRWGQRPRQNSVWAMPQRRKTPSADSNSRRALPACVVPRRRGYRKNYRLRLDSQAE